MDLVIVESPAKARTLQSLFGTDTVVAATSGHIKDLPSNRLGVDISAGFQADFRLLPGKLGLMRKLHNQARSADRVILATDSDFEGEMIAHHLHNSLRRSNHRIVRASFASLSHSAVRSALERPRELNKNWIEAQATRRVLDRLIGFTLSRLLQKKFPREASLSAGRVQSMALMILCEQMRLQGINDKNVSSGILSFSTPDGTVLSGVTRNRSYAPDNQCIADPTEIGGSQVFSNPFRVSDISEYSHSETAPLPFTTLSLLEAAYDRFGMPPQKTSRIAQELYEGLSLQNDSPLGLISYPRTSAPHLDPTYVDALRKAIRSDLKMPVGDPFETPHHEDGGYSSPVHSAIVPTDICRLPAELNGCLIAEQAQLYSLIWYQTVASQMPEAVWKIITTRIESPNSDSQLFHHSRSLKSPGFYDLNRTGLLSPNTTRSPDSNTATRTLQEGTSVSLIRESEDRKNTEIASGVSEIGVISELASCGYGQASTLTDATRILIQRGFAENRSEKLFPTDLGLAVNEVLDAHFSNFFQRETGIRLEKSLSEVASGTRRQREVLEEFYLDYFLPSLRRAEKDPVIARSMPYSKSAKAKFAVRTTHTSQTLTCPRCGSTLVKRKGPRGFFMGCRNYPRCKYGQSIR